MQFNVELSELAEKQYDIILSYISNVLKNPQALENVMDTVGKLEKMADTFNYCKSDRLRELGLRKISFAKHRYLLVYRVAGNRVIIEGIYHELQDYENSIM